MRTSLAVPVAQPLDEDVQRAGAVPRLFSKLDSAMNLGNDRERADITDSGRDRRSAPAHTPKTPLARRQDHPSAESHRGTDREHADREKEQLWFPQAPLRTRYTAIRLRSQRTSRVGGIVQNPGGPCREWS